MPVSSQELIEIAPRTGTAFVLKKGQHLRVQDVRGEQVSDLLCYSEADPREWLSSGRSLDYASKWRLAKGDLLYSNRSRPLLTIVEDTVGVHDFLLTPCSEDTFRLLYGHTNPHRGCHGNLCAALERYGITADQIPTTFNIFMNVELYPDGGLKVLPPKSKAGDYVAFRAEIDLIVGLTACSAEQSNNGSFKPIKYGVH